jgi:hypothetical protein
MSKQVETTPLKIAAVIVPTKLAVVLGEQGQLLVVSTKALEGAPTGVLRSWLADTYGERVVLSVKFGKSWSYADETGLSYQALELAL